MDTGSTSIVEANQRMSALGSLIKGRPQTQKFLLNVGARKLKVLGGFFYLNLEIFG